MTRLNELEKGLTLNKTKRDDEKSWIPELYQVAQELLKREDLGEQTLLGKSFTKYGTEIRRIPLGGSKIGIQIEAPDSYYSNR